MNYLTEIKLFYDWLETHELPPAAIALWHGLMHTANRSGWKSPLSISSSLLELRTGVSRSTIQRVRKSLEQAGLLEVEFGKGRSRSVYRLCSLERQLVVQIDAQVESQKMNLSESQPFVVQIESRNEPQTVGNETEKTQTRHFVPQIDAQSVGHIYKLNYTEINIKEKTNKKESSTNREQSSLLELPRCGELRLSQSCTDSTNKNSKPKTTPQPPSIDTNKTLASIESPWQSLMQGWLEYKRLRKETYKSEIGIRKCLSNLKHLSDSNPQTAQAIIDQSIANNWAGLFPLRSGAAPRGQSATGQHPGQIKQPESDTKRQELLDKLKPKPKP